MASKYLRKQVVFNKESKWHMEILNRIEGESDNFSGYVMSILKGHFDVKPEIKEMKKEQPEEAARFSFNGKIINPKK